jgi:hypothetical protein
MKHYCSICKEEGQRIIATKVFNNPEVCNGRVYFRCEEHFNMLIAKWTELSPEEVMCHGVMEY